MTDFTVEYFTEKEGELYQKPFLNFPERKVGKIDPENGKSIDFYIANFEKFSAEVHELLEKISAEQNKGSFLSYLENLRLKMVEVDGVGNYESLYTKINQLEVEIHQQIRKNRERNLSVKNAFLQELEALIEQEDLAKVSDRIKDIRNKWIKVGAVEKELQETLNAQFEMLYEKFNAAYQHIILQNTQAYQELIDQSKKIIETKAITEEVKTQLMSIQKAWKALPGIPKKDFSPLIDEFKSIHNTFFTQYNSNKASTQVQKRVELKNTLIEEVKTILKNTPQKSLANLKEIQEKWKKTGPSTTTEDEKLWQLFSHLCDEFFERKMLDIQASKRIKSKDKAEIIAFKIQSVKNAIYNDKRQLQTLEDNLGAFRLNITSKKVENLIQNSDKTLERKITVKETILKSLKSELNDLENNKKTLKQSDEKSAK